MRATHSSGRVAVGDVAGSFQHVHVRCRHELGEFSDDGGEQLGLSVPCVRIRGTVVIASAAVSIDSAVGSSSSPSESETWLLSCGGFAGSQR